MQVTSLGMKETFGAPVATPKYQPSESLNYSSESNVVSQEVSTGDEQTFYEISEKDVESLLSLAEDLQKECSNGKRSFYSESAFAGGSVVVVIIVVGISF